MLEAPVTPPHVVATEYLARLADLLRQISSRSLGDAVELLLAARANGRRVYVFGNGGSAATASHFVCDLVKTAHVNGHQPLRVFALADNAPLISAWANDTAYERVFAEQLTAFVEPGDVTIAISASGNSPSIVAGVMAARAAGARTLGLTGFDGGAVRSLVDVSIHVPSSDYGLVEDVHAALGHALSGAIRRALGSATAVTVERR